MNNFVGLTKPFVNPFLYEWWPQMGNLRKIKFVLVLLIIISLIQIGTINSKALTEAARCKKCELTLKEAITVGLKRAKDWDKGASLSRIGSVDEKMGGTRGENGTRYNWLLNFIVPGTEKELIVGVSNGEIGTVRQVRASSNEVPIKLEDIKFDSPYLLEIAKKKYGLQKSLDWATGYHFILSLLNGNPTITVFGMDRNHLFTRINFDPRNGKETGAIHKVPTGGGLLTLELGSNTTTLSKKGMAIKGISANHNDLVIWGDQKPRVFNFSVEPFMEISHNYGKSWTKLYFDKDINNAWFNSDNKLYASTKSEIWRNDPFSKTMKRILTLKTVIEKIDYSTNNNIAIFSNNCLYTSTDDGSNWDRTIENESIRYLQISNKGTLYILTNDGKVLLKNRNKWNTLKMPIQTDKPLDIKLIEDNLFILYRNSLLVRNLKNKQWKKVQIKDDQISALVKKGDNLMGYSGNSWGRSVYLIKFEDVFNEWKAIRLFDAKDRLINDLEVAKNKLYLATIPDYVWEDIN